MNENRSPITFLVTHPELAKNHRNYRRFFAKEGFKFAPDCKYLTDSECSPRNVYLIHEDQSMTEVEVR